MCVRMKKPIREYRVNVEGSYQGNYVVANSPKEALEIVQKKYPNEKLEVHLWKTSPKGKYYPSKLSKYARGKVQKVC